LVIPEERGGIRVKFVPFCACGKQDDFL